LFLSLVAMVTYPPPPIKAAAPSIAQETLLQP
jgi:hypothetical protein